MLQPDSLLSLVFPSDPQISPDGRQVVYVLTRTQEEDPHKPDKSEKDVPKPRYKSAIYLSDGGAPKQLTSGEKRDSAPRWSPDGSRLAFVSDRAGKPQLFALPLSGGEARQLTFFKAGAGEAKWSPDGSTLAFLSRGDDEEGREERGEALVVTRLRYKFNGAGFLPEQARKLYLLDLQGGQAGENQPRELHAPATEIQDFVWKPDGSGLLFVAAVDEAAEAAWQSEVFELSLSGEVRQVTRWNSALSALAPHPDGGRFAALGHPQDKLNTEDTHAFEFDMAGGEPRRLDTKMDVPAGNIVAGDCHVGALPGRPVWLGDQLTLQYTVGGSCGVFKLENGEGKPLVYEAGEVVAGFTANANGLACLRESEHAYPEVYLNGQKVTDCAAQLGDVPQRKAERVTVQNDEGAEIEGWVLRPEGDGLPAILTIHGGPHTAYGHGFVHEFQLFAERGYAVCYANPRGSVGYGQAWSEAIHGRWGSVDQADLLAFFDACLQKFPELDAGKTAVMGGSYGGYMTNWITGHTDRFGVAVTDRSICNLVSFNGTSDIAPRFWHDELGLEFIRSADIDSLWDMSPLKYVENVRTPTLIIHSEEDLRCPIEQAEQWFTALKLLGTETRFVRFPGETHELSRSGRPDRRVARLNEYLSWLDGHLKP